MTTDDAPGRSVSKNICHASVFLCCKSPAGTLTISSADPSGSRPGEAAPGPAKAASVPREIPGGDMRARTQLRKSTGGGEGRRHTEASETVRPEKQ